MLIFNAYVAFALLAASLWWLAQRNDRRRDNSAR
jgi:hypothetical protein